MRHPLDECEVAPVCGAKDWSLLVGEKNMSRTASERTMFIRGLLGEKNGQLTHQEVRPLLEAKGFDLAVQPPAKSENLIKFEGIIMALAKIPEDKQTQFKLRKKDMDNAKLIERALAKTKFDDKTVKSLMAEIDLRVAFDAESNGFNVIKNNWSKDGTSSRKPLESKNTKAKAAAAVSRQVGVLPKPKHRRDAVVVAGSNDSLDIVVKNGGVAACETRIAELRAEADVLEAAVAAVNALQEKLAAAA